MYRSKFALLIFVLATLCINAITYAQSTQSEEVIISAVSSSQRGTSLVIVDIQKMVLKPFYTDPNVTVHGLQPLAWSPNRQYLAIAKQYPIEQYQICVLTRTGNLLRCFSQPPLYNSSDAEVSLGALAWSSDSKYIYFTHLVENKASLIEVNIQTGMVNRILYEYPLVDILYSPLLLWTGSSVVMGSLSSHPSTSNIPFAAILLNAEFQPQQQTDLMPQISTVTFKRICSKISPNGNFYVAQALDAAERTQLIIFDRLNKVQHTITGTPAFPNLSAGCPYWQADERDIYFLGVTIPDKGVQIFRYSLADKIISVYYENVLRSVEKPDFGGIRPPISVSSDGQFMTAVSTQRTPNAESQIVLISSQGEYRLLLGEYSSTLYSLWVPPLP